MQEKQLAAIDEHIQGNNPSYFFHELSEEWKGSYERG